MKQHNTKKWFLSALLGSVLVACGLFGTPEETQENAYSVAVGAAITNPNVSSITPAHNTNTTPNTAIQVTFSSPQNPSTVQTNFALLGTGFSVAPSSNLNLTAMCNGRWRVRNPNNQAVVFTWDIYNSAGNNREEGNGIVPANSDVFFGTKNGQKTARVFVGTKQHSVKAANLTPCSGAMPSMPNKIAGAFTWNATNTILTFQPAIALTTGTTHTVFIGLTKPFASSFIVGSPLSMTSVAPLTFVNDQDTELTITGAGFTNTTAFFIQSTKLEVMSFTATTAKVKVPKGFIPSIYGLMAANNDGTRATLYPAFTLTQGAAPKEIDPELNYNSFVEGYVRDNQTKTPIEGATIGIPGLETTTTSDGYYLLQGVPSGRQALEIKKEGYEPLYRIAEVPVSSTGQTLTMKLAELEPKSERITMIGAGGGTHYASEDGEAGPFIRIPAGALESEVPIQFTHLRSANTLPELPQDGFYLAFAKLRPTGLVFKKPATLFLPLQEGIVIPVNQSINISYFDSREARWIDDITKGKISSINGKLFLEYEINHFTWIGGRWFDDNLTACVVDQNGNPVPNAITNYGVSDPMGIVRSTLSISNTGRTISVHAILPDGSESIAVSGYYSGFGDLNLTPCILYETAIPYYEPLLAPQIEDNEIAPFNAIYPSSADNIETGCANWLCDNDNAPILIGRLLKNASYDIVNWKKGRYIRDSLQFFTRDGEVTKKVKTTPLPGDRLRVTYTPIVPIRPDGQVLPFIIKGKYKRDNDEIPFQRTQTIRTVAQLKTANIAVNILPDDFIPSSVQTPYVKIVPQGRLWIFRQSQMNADGSVTVPTNLKALDSTGQLISSLNTKNDIFFSDDSAQPYYYNYSDQSRPAHAPFINGIATIPLKVYPYDGDARGDNINRLLLQYAAPFSRLSPTSASASIRPQASVLAQPFKVLPETYTGISDSAVAAKSPSVGAKSVSFWSRVGDWWGNTVATVQNDPIQAAWFGLGFVPFVGGAIDCVKGFVQIFSGDEVDLFSAEIGCIGLSMDAITTLAVQPQTLIATRGILGALRAISIISARGKKAFIKLGRSIFERFTNRQSEAKVLVDEVLELEWSKKLFFEHGDESVGQADRLLDEAGTLSCSIFQRSSRSANSDCDKVSVARLVGRVTSAMVGELQFNPEEVYSTLLRICCQGNTYIEGAERYLKEMEFVKVNSDAIGILNEAKAADGFRTNGFTDLKIPPKNSMIKLDGQPSEVDIIGRDRNGIFRYIEAKSGNMPSGNQQDILVYLASQAVPPAKPSLIMMETVLSSSQLNGLWCKGIQVIDIAGTVLNPELTDPRFVCP